MSTHAHDRDEQEIEALVRELIGRLIQNRQAGGQGRMPIAIGFKIFYGPEADEEDVPEVIEQVPEVSTIEDKVVVVTEVPGIAPENIRMGMTGRTLQIFAEEDGRRYHTAAPLPPCDPGSVKTRLKHGILEVVLDAAEAPVQG
jgi:HSP20 family molecular chaperone IbpA